MDFTALHRALGRQPGALTEELLDEAVSLGISETDDLDWKAALPSEKELAQSDTVKDIAAMANSGGGVIVFGVEEQNKSATGRIDIGEVTEGYERTLRRVAVSGIHPPVFGLGIHRMGGDGSRALVMVVPASVDVPHLIYRGEYFGAPIRNDADTVWMRERQLESLYRARLDDRRVGHAALAHLYEEAQAGRPTSTRAWLIGVARPRVLPSHSDRMTRDDARRIFEDGATLSLHFANRDAVHPLEDVERLNPRPGLRRWIAPKGRNPLYEAWVSAHDDGSVTLATAVGGRMRSGARVENGPSHINSADIEACIADLMALLRKTSEWRGTGDYELRIGIEWHGDDALIIQTTDQHGYAYDGGSIPLSRYTPVEASIRTDLDDNAFLDQVRELAQDAVNQGGVQNLRSIPPSP